MVSPGKPSRIATCDQARPWRRSSRDATNFSWDLKRAGFLNPRPTVTGTVEIVWLSNTPALGGIQGTYGVGRAVPEKEELPRNSIARCDRESFNLRTILNGSNRLSRLAILLGTVANSFHISSNWKGISLVKRWVCDGACRGEGFPRSLADWGHWQRHWPRFLFL